MTLGVHSPLRYSGYTCQFSTTVVDLLTRFCSECHTNDDYQNGCRDCPIGNLIHASKEYVLSESINEEKQNEPESVALKAIQTEMKKIEPGPFFDAYFIFDSRKPRDSLHCLSLDIKWMENLDETRSLKWAALDRRKQNENLVEKDKFIKNLTSMPDLCKAEDIYSIIDEMSGLDKKAAVKKTGVVVR